MALCVSCGQETEHEGAAPCDSRVEADICTEGGELAPDEAAGESVAWSAEYPCSKSDSSLWCHEAAACSDVHPCEHGKTTKANTEKRGAARSCGVHEPRHVNNTGRDGPSRTT